MTTAYPLHWPVGFPRTRAKASSNFRTGITGALSNVKDELGRFAKDTGKSITDLVISSNVTLGEMRPSDTGVAVYFRWDGIDCCIAVDRYPKVEDNLQAIMRVLEAHRAVNRHGGLNILRGVMRGHAALPPAEGTRRPDRETVVDGAGLPRRAARAVHCRDPLPRAGQDRASRPRRRPCRVQPHHRCRAPGACGDGRLTA